MGAEHRRSGDRLPDLIRRSRRLDGHVETVWVLAIDAKRAALAEPESQVQVARRSEKVCRAGFE